MSPGVLSCPACGLALTPVVSAAEGPAADAPAPAARSRTYERLRLILVIWLISYPVVSCTPVVLGSISGGVSLGLAGLLVGATFFFPWLAGILVLGVLMMIAR